MCFWALLWFLMQACTTNKRFTDLNVNYHYDPDFPIAVNHKISDGGDYLNVFFKVELKKIPGVVEKARLFEKYRFEMSLAPNYESTKRIALDTLGEGNYYGFQNGGHLFYYKINKTALNSALAVLKIKERNSTLVAYFDIPVVFSPTPLAYKLALFGKDNRFPRFSNMLHTSDTIKIHSFPRTEKKLWLSHYAEVFTPALPPMAMLTASKNAFNPPRSGLFSVHTENPIVIKDPGLYVLQEDTGSDDGISFMIYENRFPRVTRVEQLTESLLYISTRDERKKLLTASNPKLALDQYWLNISGSKDHGRKMIKAYYENIQQANTAFSTFKEGWKTDKGMVYSIFGVPDKVTRKGNYEEWFYNKGSYVSDIVFFFDKRPSSLSDQHYEMRRFPDYDRVWYSTVELWRKGILKN